MVSEIDAGAFFEDDLREDKDMSEMDAGLEKMGLILTLGWLIGKEAPQYVINPVRDIAFPGGPEDCTLIPEYIRRLWPESDRGSES